MKRPRYTKIFRNLYKKLFGTGLAIFRSQFVTQLPGALYSLQIGGGNFLASIYLEWPQISNIKNHKKWI